MWIQTQTQAISKLLQPSTKSMQITPTIYLNPSKIFRLDIVYSLAQPVG